MSAIVLILAWAAVAAFNIYSAEPAMRQLSVAINVGWPLFFFILGGLIATSGSKGGR